MSDRTSPVQYDIVVFGKLDPPSMSMQFWDIGGVHVLKEFATFLNVEAGATWPMLCDMYAFLEQHFNKESGWFVDKFCNVAIMSGLDKVCRAVHGKAFGEQNEEKECNRVGITSILWVAFLVKHYNITEVPEVYSEIQP